MVEKSKSIEAPIVCAYGICLYNVIIVLLSNLRGQANAIALSPFNFVASDRVIVCTPCEVAVPSQHLDIHLRVGHRLSTASRRRMAA
jgi:hypothetical protein